MKSMSSGEFRKTYPRLEVETLVTVHNHVIGKWTPVRTYELPIHTPSKEAIEAGMVVESSRLESAPRHSQAKRDAILRKVNKGV